MEGLPKVERLTNKIYLNILIHPLSLTICIPPKAVDSLYYL